MKTVVLVKQVTDTYSERKLSEADHTLDREGTDAVIDEINERAVEQALQLKEANEGSEVVVLCMGPDRATDAIRKALSMGADAAVHLSDSALHGSCAVQTARALTKLVGTQEGWDLVIAGNSASDGQIAAVPASPRSCRTRSPSARADASAPLTRSGDATTAAPGRSDPKGCSVHPRLLVLWDIDRTLLDVSHLISEAMTAAVADVLGVERPQLAPIVGRPESASLHDSLVLGGMDEHEATAALPRAAATFTEQLGSRVPLFPHEGLVLPGARELLAVLDGTPSVVQSVLTGSLRANAQLKLDAFDLTHHVDLVSGAYGDDAFERAELVAVARQRAGSRYETAFDGTRTLLIGDSLHDVDAARTSGAGLVAVATSVVSADELAARGAKLVLAGLTSPYAVAAVLAGGSAAGDPERSAA